MTLRFLSRAIFSGAIFQIFTISAANAQLTGIPSREINQSEKRTSTLRAGGSSYIRKMEIARPRAAKTADELATVNPNLLTLLPGFRDLMKTAEVSSRFTELYDRKIYLIKRGDYPTSHNFFDCETILRLEHPKSGRKVLLVQADMDVVTDGSDPGRASKLADYNLARSSDWYLPETSYSWGLSSGSEKNPFLDYYPKAVAELQKMRADVLKKAESDKGIIWREILKAYDDQIYRMKARGMGSGTRGGLGSRRYLLATRDPFVVLPAPWVNKSAEWSPQTGDYAAVVYKNKIYPAILGDAGPKDKVGEASLRLARKLNPKADGKTRAISDVTVTYLFFPKTRSSFKEPDLKLWRDKVMGYLKEIGGISEASVLHDWSSD